MMHFSRAFTLAGVLCAVLTCLAGNAIAQKKGATKKNLVPASDADYVSLRSLKQISGTLIAFESSAKHLTLRIDTPHYEPNPNYKPPRNQTGANTQFRQVQQYQKLQRDQQQAMRARTPQQRQQALRRVAQDMARFQQQQAQAYSRLAGNLNRSLGKTATNSSNGPFRLVTVSKDYEMTLQSDATIRKMFLPVEFDDAGNYKVYTEKEKAALRGSDPTRPGYSATIEEIAVGAQVTLYLAPKREARPDDDLVGNVERPLAKMMVLTKEALASK